ncbi:hypothetical protein F1D05_23255 [Kribbella qitaiheensis]|uniref:Uncharacterized protein n=1 Tax=Kribbella qitaiheensis TaxID=1544730 RepID=A0A7G6X227_9ACTN|nr:hypothetical protein [Kribbella qitaiheensis]QNE20292.1 hypothetical protein F1D05_23255 [Kribbella qitaiheensis]
MTLLKINFANTTEQLRDALPAKYGNEVFDRRTNKEAFGWSPRDDPFEGHKVDPESCREILRTGGRKVDTFAEFPYLPYAVADPKTNAFPVQVELTSLPVPYSDKYMDLLFQAAPQCATMRTDDRDPASIVERPVPGLGSRSRYILRTYLSHGKKIQEGVVLFRTQTYLADIRLYTPHFTEQKLLAFAKALETTLDRQLP